jgi:menaquinone-dependent protoporphyrinogen oxidase
MNVLVTAASQQGATYEIAEAIGRVLRERGFETTVSRPEQVDDATAYDAVVLGSAIYSGHWLEPAKDFARRFAHELTQRPVWLFSSGPVGDPRRKLVQKMTADPLELPTVLAQTHAREHRILAGKLAGGQLGRTQRLSLLLFRGFQGDWRDWTELERYARAIADTLDAGAANTGTATTRVKETA